MLVEQAIQLALDTVKKLFAGTDYQLEEIQLEPDDSYDVTVSYRGSNGSPQPFIRDNGRTVLGIDGSRAYKIVSISAGGEVKGVRIRQIVLS